MALRTSYFDSSGHDPARGGAASFLRAGAWILESAASRRAVRGFTKWVSSTPVSSLGRVGFNRGSP